MEDLVQGNQERENMQTAQIDNMQRFIGESPDKLSPVKSSQAKSAKSGSIYK